MSSEEPEAIAVPLLLVGSRGLIALMLLFLANYPGVFAAVLFARAMTGSDYAEASVAVGLVLVASIRSWRPFVLGLFSDAFYRWVFGTTRERR